MGQPQLLLRRVAHPAVGLADVVCRDGVVESVSSHREDLAERGAIVALDCAGGRLIPGLTDHHVHLMAWAAALESVDLSRGDVDSQSDLLPLAAAPVDSSGWVRATGYRERFDRLPRTGELDDVRSDVPVRIQHVSGAVWLLNTTAVDHLARTEEGAELLERDAVGRPTGRIWRRDEDLARILPVRKLALDRVGESLSRHGVTAVVDATPGDRDLGSIVDARGSGALPQRVTVMTAQAPADESVALGPLKLVLEEHALPPIAELVETIRRARADERAVAVHCVTRVELQFAVTALEQAPALAGSRVEHGGVITPDDIPRLRALGLTVVTQPGFIAARGDHYLDDVDPDDLPHLYRQRSLRDAGIPLLLSSDAPFGPSNPWEIIDAACRRRTPSGHVIGACERLTPDEALTCFMGGSAGALVVAEGMPADLVVLRPDADVGQESEPVMLTVVAGDVVYRRENPGPTR